MKSETRVGSVEGLFSASNGDDFPSCKVVSFVYAWFARPSSGDENVDARVSDAW